MTDLEEPTEFDYYFTDNGVEIKDKRFHFKSKVFSRQDITVVTFGDHDQEAGQSTLNALKHKKYDLLLFLGDVAYDIQNRNGLQGDEYFAMMEEVFTRAPVILTGGNHENFDKGRLFSTRFLFPGCRDITDNHLLAFRAGKHVFFGINMDLVLNIDPKSYWQHLDRWQEKVENVMANFRHDFRIFFSHRPFYTPMSVYSIYVKHAVSGIMRMKPIEDLVHKIGANLYLLAHMHEYERNHDTFNYFIKKEEGSTVVIVGTGGTKSPEPPHSCTTPFSITCLQNVEGFLVLSDRSGEMSAELVSARGGAVLDSFTVK